MDGLLNSRRTRLLPWSTPEEVGLVAVRAPAVVVRPAAEREVVELEVGGAPGWAAPLTEDCACESDKPADEMK